MSRREGELVELDSMEDRLLLISIPPLQSYHHHSNSNVFSHFFPAESCMDLLLSSIPSNGEELKT